MKLNAIINILFSIGLASLIASMLIRESENTIVLKTAFLCSGALLLIATVCLGIFNWLKSRNEE